MNASITAVFEACCNATGHPFYLRHRRIACPFHDGKRPTLALNEAFGAWHCFVASCPSPSGGVLAAPIAFGLAQNASEASQWLSDRRLIPPPDSHGHTTQGEYVAPRRLYVDTSALTTDQILTWYHGQLALRAAIGKIRYNDFHRSSAATRYEREEQKKTTQQKRIGILRLVFELVECDIYGSRDPWGPTSQEVSSSMFKYPQIYTK